MSRWRARARARVIVGGMSARNSAERKQQRQGRNRSGAKASTSCPFISDLVRNALLPVNNLIVAARLIAAAGINGKNAFIS